MTILGFDTSTAASTAAVLLPDGEVVESLPSPERLGARPAHAAELLPAIHEVMQRARVRFDELDAIAVGSGPGTFTGLRIGISTARALGKANGLPLRPVSSLQALAAPFPDRWRLPLIDAKRGEVFGTLLEGAEERWPPFALRIGELVARLADAGVTPLAGGDGSVRFRDELEAAGLAVLPSESPLHLVNAGAVCRLAVGVPDTAPEQVVPDYLREPDAVPR